MNRELDLNDVLIIEDIDGNTHEDIILDIKKYSIENNSLYKVSGETFYLDFMNNFEHVSVDIASESPINNSVSKYKLKEIWAIDEHSMIKLYSTGKRK